MVIVNNFKSPVDKGAQMSPLLVSIMFWDCFTKTKNIFCFKTHYLWVHLYALRAYFVNDEGLRMLALKIRFFL